ncbi:MAG TPA: sulfatase [Arenimonas sp.]|uniref:sulfatase family protein n=1 Tax=Arenimonas sp. TaxID=1872635 RepID=UPI002BEA2CB4|nr:sulfatase [Arenimonas sp.]HMB57347.1 sulfatase [Arenimonas sp.]
MPISRRRLLKLAATSAAGTALLAAGCARSAKRSERPNIVFFLVDDQRNDTLGCTGDRIVRTPTIDALAAQGTLFRNAFVTTSICPSSRASLFTGVSETRHHFTFNTPPIARALAEASYPALLKQAGYRTAVIGKFGVQMQDEVQKNFLDVFDPRDLPIEKRGADGRLHHNDEVNVEHALTYLRGCDPAQPFLLSLNFSATHAEDEDMARQYHPIAWAEHLYSDVTFPPPKLADPKYFDSQPDFLKHSLNRTRYFWRFDTPEKYQRSLRDYYRMISGVDHQIGQVLAELDRLGLRDNTVIVYAADNGYYMGDRGFADKWSHYEESLRVPMIIVDPRHHGAGGVDAMALNVDVPATLLDLAGIARPAHYQGRSLRPMLTGKTPGDWRHDFLCQHTMNDPAIPKWIGVRDERYVYARYFEQQPAYEFLHDLQTDPTEFVNLAKDPAQADLLAKMRARCDALKLAWS